MTEVTPARPSQPKLKHQSIKTKILLALLTLSLCPLILTVAINRARMLNVQEYVKSQLKQEAEKDLLRIATRRAAIAYAMLDNVEAETPETLRFSPRRSCGTQPPLLARNPIRPPGNGTTL